MPLLNRSSVLLVALAACSSQPASPRLAQATANAAPSAPLAAAPPLDERDVTLSTHFHKKPAKLHAAGPRGWETKQDDESVDFKMHEDDAHPRKVQVRFGISLNDNSCDTPTGHCTDADLDKRARSVFERVEAGWLQPNVNTGKPALDAVRATITSIERSDAPNGVSIAAIRVTYPGLGGPYIPTVVVACSLHRKGDDFTVEARGLAHTDLEKEVVPPMIEACKRLALLP